MGSGGRVLLVVGLAMPGTGFTRVLAALACGLNRRYAVHWFGLGRVHGALASAAGVELHYCPFKPHSAEAAAALRRLALRIEPTAVLLLGQPPWLARLLEALRSCWPSCTLLLYTPVEGTLTDADWLKPLAFVDRCILYTESARQNLVALHAARQGTVRELRLPELHVLPHGVDTTVFHPIGAAGDKSARANIRRRLFPDRPELADAFIVLNANFPYPRKRIDLTIRGFAAFATAVQSNVYLYLHHIRIDRYMRDQIGQISRQAGIGDQLLHNVLNARGEVLDDERLNLLYNACDVGLTTAMGEAWGLCSFEHAATRVAQIVPDHTTFAENWDGAAEFIPTTGIEHVAYEYADMHTVEAAAVARTLERLYRDRALLCSRARAAFDRSTLSRYRWAAITDQLDCLLRT